MHETQVLMIMLKQYNLEYSQKVVLALATCILLYSLPFMHSRDSMEMHVKSLQNQLSANGQPFC